LGAILEEAITDYEAKAFWDSFDAGYERLADDAERWAEVEDERAREAATLTDNLDDS
jgi:hypothetical protein